MHSTCMPAFQNTHHNAIKDMAHRITGWEEATRSSGNTTRKLLQALRLTLMKVYCHCPSSRNLGDSTSCPRYHDSDPLSTLA
ncbi:uncharacterized protein MYCFIDRAFT_183103 [Pseudocercospora fijiensis CIRAD86]|uniref:Uncharacterized protein n=1 Tax=Pseudocercospora fijiensis (strain CIRAD86) TaxID=383855 RepID=M3AZ30_PSEFD|nr:uncharacterized protein MYCFIDRAFT_183103 [Pseudocercospora fijiensis CIRAD86]EME82443.1 hypothetical protein MYCFIDRAFT_183103 [Pseudocercospora fijiensis CIRAD86]